MTTDTLIQPSFTLTADQQTALSAFNLFLLDPMETVFVLSGYSGCGKSTLVKTLLERLDAFQKTVHMVDGTFKEYDFRLTATTNKAAENLRNITGHPVQTIHSFLGLRVVTDFKTNVTTLMPRPQNIISNLLVFIDEASFIDKQLLGYVFSRTQNCKIVFIGDPAQLIPIKAASAPVFNAGFSGAVLTQVVRQAENNPIVDLSTKFRHTVNTGDFFGFKPDGHHVVRLDREAFNKAIELEFTRPDWKFADSKILAWTNKCVIAFNQYVRNLVKGDPHFQVGDYAVCNNYLNVGKLSIKTDQLVQITEIGSDYVCHEVLGNRLVIDNIIAAFQPKSLTDKNNRIKQARKNDESTVLHELENRWVDLRGAYACTINKAQGSTYDKVFIDLDDIKGCNTGDQIARMMYVAVSRARNHVYLCGDLA